MRQNRVLAIPPAIISSHNATVCDMIVKEKFQRRNGILNSKMIT